MCSAEALACAMQRLWHVQYRGSGMCNTEALACMIQTKHLVLLGCRRSINTFLWIFENFVYLVNLETVGQGELKLQWLDWKSRLNLYTLHGC